MEFIDHELVPDYEFAEILYEERTVFDNAGAAVDGLHAVWITLNNPVQLYS